MECIAQAQVRKGRKTAGGVGHPSPPGRDLQVASGYERSLLVRLASVRSQVEAA